MTPRHNGYALLVALVCAAAVLVIFGIQIATSPVETCADLAACR